MTTKLTLTKAQEIIAAALAGVRSMPPRPIAVAVCDNGGHLLAIAREQDAPPLLAQIAQAKAFTCVAYGKPTTELASIAESYPNWFNGISRVAQESMGQPLIASKGGMLCRDHDGTLLGAVGVAGETGDIDDELAKTGIAIAGFLF